MDNSEFQLVFRGYDKGEVDAAVSAMREELDHVRDYNYKAASEVEFLKSEIASLKQRLKRDAGTGYAELGAQFEQTLRVAEEQARKLMTDAGQDALRVRESFRWTAARAVAVLWLCFLVQVAMPPFNTGRVVLGRAEGPASTEGQHGPERTRQATSTPMLLKRVVRWGSRPTWSQ